MKKYMNGRRVFAQSVAIATTMFTCVAIQANEHENKNQAGKAKTEAHADKHLTAESFIKQAAMSGQLEVQVGQLAQQKAQNQQVKQLGQTLVQDHQQANQKLRQIAQQKNVQLSQQMDQKQQQKLEKLRNASGAEFDKEFIKHALQHHKKDIQKFEQASSQFQNEPELRSFAEQTLPKLKKHHQMAQSAAGAIGVDVAAIEAEADAGFEAVGAPAPALRGEAESKAQNRQFNTEGDQQPRPRSAIDAGADADLPDIDANADIDVNERDNALTAETEVDVENDNEVFQKGDGKILGIEFRKGDNEVLGLPTSNSDGTILGLFPAPSREIEAGSREVYTSEELANGKVDQGVETVQGAEHETVAVGGAAGVETERVESRALSRSETVEFDDAPDEVQTALKARGWNQPEGQLQKVTLYRAMINGRSVVVNEQGQVVSQSQPQR